MNEKTKLLFRSDKDIAIPIRRKTFRQLLTIASPIMLNNFLQNLYNLTDTYFLGQLGKNELSSPAIAFNIIFFLLLFSLGFGQAAGILISQNVGKGDKEKTDFYLGQITSMMIFGGLILLPIVQLTIPIILRGMQVPAEIFSPTEDYLRIVLAGLPATFLTFALHAALYGRGDSLTPLVINIISVSLNTLFDWLLIFGIGIFPMLAVRGAALATLIARIVNMAITLAVLVFRKKGMRLKLRNMRPHWESFRLIIKIGLPASLGLSASALGFTVLQGVVNGYGTAVIAAFNIGNRIISTAMMPTLGIGQALTTVVGQKLGARQTGLAFLALRQASLFCLSFITPCMLLTFLFGQHVIKFFVADAEVIQWGEQLFRIISPSVVFFALLMVFNAAMQGGGDTKAVAFLNVFRLWGVRLPLAFLLCVILAIGPHGLWISMFVSNLLTATGSFLFLVKRPWEQKINPDQI